MLEVLLHVLKHSLVTFVVLFLCYILIELLEEKILDKYKTNKLLKGKFAPVVSAGFGLIPQCGFSVVITDLYSKGSITIGSLMAIFIATSDEALPIMLAQPNQFWNLLIILGVKFVYAVIVGMTIDALFKKNNKRYDFLEEKVHIHNHEEDKNENHEHAIEGCCNHKLEGKKKTVKDFLLHPLIHSLKIFAYILVVNFIFHLLLEYVGEETLMNFMNSTGAFQPFLAALVGLIPNCSASVVITELFLKGGLSLGSCLAGLSVNSGIALIVLFRLNKNKVAENTFITVSLYLIGVLLGVVVNLF